MILNRYLRFVKWLISTPFDIMHLHEGATYCFSTFCLLFFHKDVSKVAAIAAAVEEV